MRQKFIYILLLLTVLASTACQDDFRPQTNGYVEGTAHLKVSLTYDLENEIELGSRANLEYSGGEPGNAIGNISQLAMLVYDADGDLVDRYNILGYGSVHSDVTNVNHTNTSDNTQTPGDNGSGDKSLGKVEYNLKLQSGRYYIYAVANMPDLDDYAEAYKTRAGLKGIKRTWSSTLADNSEMFGVYSPKPDRQADDESTITVSASDTQLHSWVRRLASKVTVSFDGSDLYDNVVVYIEDIALRDIPSTCTLGDTNTPGRDAAGNELDRSLIYSASYADRLIRNGQRFTVQTLPADLNSVNVISHIHVCNKGHKYLGRGDDSDPDGIVTADPDIIHSNAARALFFYENAQGEGKSKKQSNDGISIDYPSPDSTVTGSGWKDDKPWGTFVEVTGHYKCTTPDGHVGSGPIVYRFMLGQDNDTDYNAFRNTHYQLTLQLKGYGNDYDWHIDYKEERGVHVSSPLYISYLYNKSMVTPVKIAGELAEPYIKVEVLEPGDPNSADLRYWAPWGDNTPGFPDPRGHQDPESGDHNYFYQGYVPMNGPWISFLGLRQSHILRITDPAYDGASSIKYPATDPKGVIKQHWTTNEEGERKYRILLDDESSDRPQTFAAGSDGYSKAGEGDYVVQISRRDPRNGNPLERIINLPLFTRPKEIVTSSGFSGNNVYDSYPRNARIKITAWIKESDGSVKQYQQYVNVIQVRRVVNPKGVWRSMADNNPFRVRMMVRRADIAGSQFTLCETHGDWSAEVFPGSDNIITLSSNPEGLAEGARPQVGVQRIQGASERAIDFNIHFTGAKGFAVIRVRYNNYTCEHDIFVRKGDWNDDVTLTNADGQSVTFASRNVDHFTAGNTPVLTQSPLDEGGLFRRGSYSAIKASNQFRPGFGRPIGTVVKDGATITNNSVPYTTISAPTPFEVYRPDGSEGTETWAGLKAASSATVKTWTINEASPYQIASMTDYYNLIPTRSDQVDFGIKFAYGVLYCDGATDTATDPEIAFEYGGDGNRSASSNRGMQGAFVYQSDATKGFNHIFLPVGAQGSGRRKNAGGWRNNDPEGTLRYASRSNFYGFYSNDNPMNMPLFLDLYRRPGALYWVRDWFSIPDATTFPNPATNGADFIFDIRKSSALDINYFTFGFEGYENAACVSEDGSDSDACLIRLVRK